MAIIDDTISIAAAGQTVSGWQSVKISRGLERGPSSFTVGLTEKYPGVATEIALRPGEPIDVLIGSELVMRGYVDRYASGISENTHQVSITGRSISQDLVDCSAGFATYQINNTTLVNLAKQLAQPFGVPISAPDGDSGVIPQFTITLTDTPFAIIERVCRWAAFLPYDGPDGSLIIGKLADRSMASGFAQGVNAQSASVSLAVDQRYTEIDPVFATTDMLHDLLDTGSTSNTLSVAIPKSTVYDVSFPNRADKAPRYRRLIVVSEQSQSGSTYAKDRAAVEMMRRWGRSQALTVECDSWRDSGGALWQPNALAPINFPALKLPNLKWLISDVTFSKSLDSGTTATIILMPPEAFIPQIEVLQPFDPAIAQALAGGAANYSYAPR